MQGVIASYFNKRDGVEPASRRGPYCVLAFEAVALLRERGYKVRRLEDGFPEWKAAGLPHDLGLLAS